MSSSNVPRVRNDDAAVLSRLRAGDAATFDGTFRRWYPSLVRFAQRILTDRAQAEEIVQDVFLELWHRRETLEGTASAQAWLFLAARNRAFNVLRRERMIARLTPRVNVAIAPARYDEASDALAGIEEAELHDAISHAIDALPPRCREVFMLSRRRGLRHAQIAAQLGITVKAVEAQITRALRQLRDVLSPWLRA